MVGVWEAKNRQGEHRHGAAVRREHEANGEGEGEEERGGGGGASECGGYCTPSNKQWFTGLKHAFSINSPPVRPYCRSPVHSAVAA